MGITGYCTHKKADDRNSLIQLMKFREYNGELKMVLVLNIEICCIWLVVREAIDNYKETGASINL